MPLSCPANSFLHIGYPKCASSFLQAKYFTPENKIANLTKNPDWADYIYRHLLSSQSLYFNSNVSPDSFYVSPGHLVGISAEGYFGGLNKVDFEIMLQRTRLVLGDPKVLIIIRNQLDLVYSYYIQMVRTGYFRSACSYLKEIRWNQYQSIWGQLNFLRAYEMTKKYFSDVLVMPLETTFQLSQQDALRALNTFFGLDADFGDGAVVNSGCPDSEVKMMRILNYFFRHNYGLSYHSTFNLGNKRFETIGLEAPAWRIQFKIPKIASELGPRVFRGNVKNDKLKFKEKYTSLFYDEFAESNRTLANMLGLNLEGCGYF